MGSVGKLRFFGIGRQQESSLQNEPVPPPSSHSDTLDSPAEAEEQSSLLHTLGWLSAGAGALGLGLVIGRELRQRYKFHRRTPYDIYAHAGDYQSDLEFGVGI